MMKKSVLIGFFMVLMHMSNVTTAGQDRWPVLHYEQEEQLDRAVNNGDTQTVHIFFEAGLNPNYLDSSGKRTFELAASSGHEAIVRMFIARGADMHRVDRHGITPVMGAAIFKRTPVILMLLLHDMSVNKNNFSDQVGQQIARLKDSSLPMKIEGAYLIEGVQNSMARVIAQEILSLQLPPAACKIVLDYLMQEKIERPKVYMKKESDKLNHAYKQLFSWYI